MLTICSGEEVARPQARLLVILVRIAGVQQADPGVLVEFGGHPGDSVVVGDGPLRTQSVGHRGCDIDAQPYPFVVHAGRQPL
jgi:hypothetical protein